MKEHIRKAIEAPINSNIPKIDPGDSVKVDVIIKEGERERTQEFKGLVIKTKKGGNNSSFTVRRIASHGIGVERTFLLRSPRVSNVTITRKSKVRRSKLYYMRNLTGKKTRLKERQPTN